MKTKKSPFVIVAVPVFNRKEKTRRFLEKFKKVQYNNYKIVIVDDNSSDGTSRMIEKNFPKVKLIKGNGNLWWTGGTNEGVKYALKKKAKYVLTINDDSQFEPDFLTHLVKTAEKYPNTIIGSLLLFNNDRNKIWSLGGYMHWGNKIFGLNYEGETVDLIKDIKKPYYVDIICGNGTLVPTHIYKKIGLYNYQWLPQVHADSEFIMRSKKAGYEAIIEPKSILYNDIITQPTVSGFYQIFFDKRSDQYWRPILYIHFKYAPLKYKLLGIVQRYWPFIKNEDKSILSFRIVRRIIKNLLKIK